MSGLRYLSVSDIGVPEITPNVAYTDIWIIYGSYVTDVGSPYIGEYPISGFLTLHPMIRFPSWSRARAWLSCCCCLFNIPGGAIIKRTELFFGVSWGARWLDRRDRARGRVSGAGDRVGLVPGGSGGRPAARPA